MVTQGGQPPLSEVQLLTQRVDAGLPLLLRGVIAGEPDQPGFEEVEGLFHGQTGHAPSLLMAGGVHNTHAGTAHVRAYAVGKPEVKILV